MYVFICLDHFPAVFVVINTFLCLFRSYEYDFQLFGHFLPLFVSVHPFRARLACIVTGE